MEKLEYDSYYESTLMNLFIIVPKVDDLIYSTNGSHEVSVEFCVLKFSSFG